MSIYDGLCDVGSAVNNRCPQPASRFRNQYAWCEGHGQGYSPLGDRSWSEIVAQRDARQGAIRATIERAEAEGHFLYRDGEIYSPREIRAILKGGYSITSLTIEEGPLAWAASLEREAQDCIEEAKEKRAKARHIRSEYQRLKTKAA